MHPRSKSVSVVSHPYPYIASTGVAYSFLICLQRNLGVPHTSLERHPKARVVCHLIKDGTPRVAGLIRGWSNFGLKNILELYPPSNSACDEKQQQNIHRFIFLIFCKTKARTESMRRRRTRARPWRAAPQRPRVANPITTPSSNQK